MNAAATLRLQAWLSPAFPVGAFAYSHGLEEAVEAGLIDDAASLAAWLADLFRHGSARQDALFVAAAWRATRSDDAAALHDVAALALALCGSAERRLETGAMGRAFAATLASAWPEAVAPALPQRVDIAYPVAYGAACAAAAIDMLPALEAYGLAFAGNLISAAVRLGPIGQTDAQRVIAQMLPQAEGLARDAADGSLDDLGGCALRSEIASLRHETLYSRLFRS